MLHTKNISRYILLVVYTCLFIYGNSQTQNTDTTIIVRKDTMCSITMSYTGNTTFIGLQVGLYIPLKKKRHIVQSKQYTEVGKTVEKGFLINAGGHYINNYHTMLFLTANYTQERLTKRNTHLYTQLGIGISRTFLDEETYQVNPNGKVQLVKNAGSYYAMLNLAAGVTFTPTKIHNLKFFGCVAMHTYFPYNGFVLFRPLLNVGILQSINTPLFKTRYTIKTKALLL